MDDIFKIFGRFYNIKVKIIKYRSLRCLEIAKIGKMIMKTESVRFAKIRGFFNNFGGFIQTFQSPIAAKPLEASGEAASLQ